MRVVVVCADGARPGNEVEVAGDGGSLAGSGESIWVRVKMLRREEEMVEDYGSTTMMVAAAVIEEREGKRMVA